jgi:outer membrane protein OmpA-like peptidoglycan-associated protein
LRNFTLICFPLILAAQVAIADPLTLIDAESTDMQLKYDIGVSALGAYETGYTPDWYGRAAIEFGITDWAQVSGGLDYTSFLDKGEASISEYDATAKVRILVWKPAGRILAYGRFKQILAPNFLNEYDGPTPGVGLVVNPHADTGIDFGGGIAGFAQLGKKGLALAWDLDYARTESRDYYPPYGTEGYKNRYFASVMPAWYKADKFLVGAQLRGTYWSDRGYMLEILPQANWEPLPGCILTLGASVPAYAGGTYKAFVGMKLRVNLDVEGLYVIREGDNIRLRAYLNFIGDKSDLFEPKNMQFGKKNRAIMNNIAKYIKRYPGYHVVIEGHTNRAKFNMTFEEEQRRELMPLATARAAAVRAALLPYGFSASRLSTIAYGSLHPIAKFEDAKNCWKNRRVEILLEKPEKTDTKTNSKAGAKKK